MSSLDEAIEAFESMFASKKRLMARFLFKENLYPGQHRLLFFLHHNQPANQSSIAQALMVSPASVTVVLRRMEKAGLVSRVTDKGDRRRQLVRLTDKGEEIVATAISGLRKFYAECFKGFSNEEIDAAKRVFEKIRNNIDSFTDEV
ncbi:MarR family transcriptional regulator [Spirochaetia bacterium 38H-sp]|uniref:MarR family transcriptional regulator n=1 Tax=Rarispira pelagica TaxID=3141764 RepID=A0ABU9UBQ2_9SPIR